MDNVVEIIGIAFIVIALLCFGKPNVFKRMLDFFKHGKRLYLAGLMRFVLAVIFLLAANQCNKPRIIGAFGILFLMSGVLIFMLGPKKLSPLLQWYLKQSVLLLRIIAVLIVAIGALIIYSA